jgi:hypothetical protein
MKYRKKPVVVEAVQWTGNIKLIVGLGCNSGDWKLSTSSSPMDIILQIKTPEGIMLARIGDYIIKGVRGELYPCRADIFEETYERVNE